MSEKSDAATSAPTSFDPASVEDVITALASHSYIADRGLATAIFLALKRHKPLLLEGEPGVGKTEVARTLAALLGTRLIRLQCYEGIDQSSAVYEWNYARQLLYIRMLEADRQTSQTNHGSASAASDAASEARLRDVFGPEFLIRRPLLEALDASRERAPVLLIDELDRSDAEFEAYLLELLSDYQITIPEIGPQRAAQPPVVVITSNRTRDIHDALRRRCLYYWIEYPTLEKEYAIVRTRVPEASDLLARQVVTFVQLLRNEDFFKAPGVAETLDWLGALTALGQKELTEGAVQDTLSALLKYQDDVQKLTYGGLLVKLLGKTHDAVAQG
ncbi:MAG TPA: MoxR family ATPase [Ktedonobacterales bacterium]|nr:MoxR family ATPase [Ktedonobacterales bacterium]